MTLRLTLGVDPGLSGAVVALADGEPAGFIDMPTRQAGKWAEVDGRALIVGIRELRAAHPGAYISAMVEKVGARPTDGGTSAFRFGESSGRVKCAFEALGIPYELAIPAVWKRHFGLLGQDKDAARQLALVRFPTAAHWLQRKKDNGRADALLLALYGDAIAGTERAAA
ncbi:hypothetical protein [Coralloluteibacterium thermophilus]|uniref:Uncharacterized protein n=1 Tax=Coralloluteibacterium thermophilum TaxID=2707049 RepID=A0ABV9NIW3_9GAMM